MYENELQKLGLTSGEARVYSSLLNLKSSTVGPITKKSGVAYSKIYEVLQRLIEKGLVSFIIKDKTKYFQAIEPSRLKDYIDKKREEIEENQEILHDLLPKLNSLISEKNKQESEIFLGEKGVMTAYDVLLSRAKNNSLLRFLYMHNPLYDEKVYEFYYGRVNYNFKRIDSVIKEKNIKWIGIISKSNVGKKLGRPPKGIDQRYVSFPVPGNIDITDDAILITIWSSSKPMGILIQSEEVANSFKEYFDSAWKLAKK